MQRLRAGWQHRPPAGEATTPDGPRERMWTFYLAYSQAGFAADHLDDERLGIGRDGAAPAVVIAS